MATELIRMTTPTPERSRILPAAVLALVIEGALIGGAYRCLTQAPRSHTVPPTVVTLALAPPAPPAPPQPKPAPPPSLPKTAPTPPPVRHVASERPPTHAAAQRPVTPPVVAPPQTEPAPPAPVAESSAPAPSPAEPVHAPAPAKTSAPSAPDKSFEGALRAAIQAALRYPESARMAGISGRARVAFKYQDGVASDISIVVSSGTGLLDRAAVAAVRDAAFPKPAAEWVGKTLSEQVWVTFDLDDDRP